MMVLNTGNKEYKVRFSFNSFCDTDLMDRTTDLLEVFQSAQAKDDGDVYSMNMVKDLFVCVRDLLFVGFQKYNPVETVQDVGDILDEYHDEGTNDDKHGFLDLFTKLAKELMDEGFLGDLMGAGAEEAANQKVKAIPQNRKPKQK